MNISRRSQASSINVGEKFCFHNKSEQHAVRLKNTADDERLLKEALLAEQQFSTNLAGPSKTACWRPHKDRE
jgi:hypothetical protein